MTARGGERWRCGGKCHMGSNLTHDLPSIELIHSKPHLQPMYLHLCVFLFSFFFYTIIPSLKAFCNFPQAEYITHCVYLTQRTSRRSPAIDFQLTPSASAHVTKSVFTGRDIAVKNRRGINIFPLLSILSCAHQCFQRTEKLVIWLLHRQRHTLLIILLSRAAIPRLHRTRRRKLI